MPTLENYNHFAGTHWETGTVRNFMAQRGFTAPHTGEPFSEALLMGVSGGLVMGYFTFLYEGYDPQCNILTRNTFDPLDTMLSRLGVIQEILQTAKAERAVKNLINTLEEGQPAIVWADMWSLPYNGLSYDEGMWGSMPILVYGYEEEKNLVTIADRARVPLTVTPEELATARGRVKKIKNRILTLQAPNPDKLAAAVHLGLCDTVRLFTEKPPKGSKNNFGLNAYQYWAKMLRMPKQRLSWEKQFGAGLPMYAGLKSAYEFAFLFGKDDNQDAERTMYASFLDEAALLLNQPALKDAARGFRKSGEAWRQFAYTLLPTEVQPFAATRELMWNRHQLFLEQGGAALDEILSINARLADIRAAMKTGFPLNQAQVEAHRERMAAQLLLIHDLEAEAIAALQAAVS
ncbi:MAG: BtrH N-terminal domain-containing protein [Candidatus Promineifilaceae bacterium]|nr:BtrH N-terminal domain-containing protein [Candidatus Promineifilaceae bacterium]